MFHCCLYSWWSHNIEQNDIWHNGSNQNKTQEVDIMQNDAQHSKSGIKVNYTQHGSIMQNKPMHSGKMALGKMTLSIVA